jgi:hypothetical protein
MKKFLIVAVAAAVCVGLSGLAMADLKVGGKICFDTYMQNFSDTYMGKSDAAPDITGFSETGFENNSSTNLNVRWTEGNFGMYLELAMGASNDQTVMQATRFNATTGSGLHPVDNVYTRYSYGWWDFGAGKLTVGQDNTGFSPLNPMQMCGTGSGQFKIIGIGFGNIYSGRVYQVRGDFKLGEIGSIGIALVDPHGSSLGQGLYLTNSGGTHFYWGYQITPAGNEETTMPRVDISAVLKFGPVSVYPGLLYNKKTWDDVAPGQDDTITTSLYSLGVKYATGPFGIAAEYNAGKNPGDADLLTDGTYFGYGSSPHFMFPLDGEYGTGFDMAAVVDSTGKVSDTDFSGYWVDLSYKFGYNTIHAIYGQQHIENDSVFFQFTGTDLQMENTRTVMTFNAWIPLSKHMIVIPEVNFWDYGDRQIEGQDDVELGKANIYGISWLFIF